MLGCLHVPEDVVRTSHPRAWRIPRGEKISEKEVQNVEVYSHKTRNEDEDTPKPITPTLYKNHNAITT